MEKGIEATIHVIRVIGKQPGPKIYVGGGVHGDEINGIEAALRVPREIDPKKMKGELVIVPVQNPAAYLFRMRLNPYDPIDPDWVHPGSPKGYYSQRMKHILNKLASDADCVIDLHTSGRGGTNNPMIYVPPEIGNGAGRRSLELALAFGGDRIFQGAKEEDYGWPVSLAMPFVAVRDGRAGIYPEAGQGGAGAPEELFVNYFVTGVLNVMRAMAMIESEVYEQGERLVVDPLTENTQTVKTRSGGIFNPQIEIGELVKKGQVLGEVHSIPIGVEQVTAPIEGLVTWFCCFGPVSKGDRLISISSSH